MSLSLLPFCFFVFASGLPPLTICVESKFAIIEEAQDKKPNKLLGLQSPKLSSTSNHPNEKIGPIRLLIHKELSDSLCSQNITK